MVTLEQKKEEALKRMEILELHSNVVEDFRAGTINKSEFKGLLYWLNDNEKQMVSDFEDEHDALVYHVIRDTTEFGVLLSLFYISNYQDEWEDDREDLKNGIGFVYVVNVDDDSCSEFGSIGFKKMFGGLHRVA